MGLYKSDHEKLPDRPKYSWVVNTFIQSDQSCWEDNWQIPSLKSRYLVNFTPRQLSWDVDCFAATDVKAYPP